MNEMLSLKEYTDIAKKILFSNAMQKVAESIYKDDMKFGQIINAVMMADWKFNGKGTKYGYRKAMVQYTVKKILKENTRKKNKNLSLDYFADNGEKTHKISEPTSENMQFSVKNIEEQDYNDVTINKIKSSNILTDIEKKIIIARIFEDKSVDELSQELNIRGEAIRQTLHRAVKKSGMSLCAF